MPSDTRRVCVQPRTSLSQDIACVYRRPALFSSESNAWCSSILRYVWYRSPFSAAKVLARVRSCPASLIVIVGEAPDWLARSRATRATGSLTEFVRRFGLLETVRDQESGFSPTIRLLVPQS